jgi:transposase
MNGYSKDLRLRVLTAVDRGTPRVEIVRLFGVSLATIGRYVKRRRETGEVAPRPSTGALSNHRHRRAEANLVGAAGDASRGDAGGALRTVGARSGRESLDRNNEPSDPSAWVDLQAKTLAAAEQDEQARSAWRRRTGLLDPRRLVFVDECGTNIGLVPLRARAPKGARAYGKAPRNRGKNTTLLASMALSGMGACVAVEGPTTKAVFEAYVEQVLAPSLTPGQVIVLDNLTAHKGERVRKLVETRGCRLLFLPSYSPDFNPIEEAFSKIKVLVRRAEARTRDALVEAIGRALAAVSKQDVWGFFVHCGYPLSGSIYEKC